MAAYVIERFGHNETFYGETAGKAKYQAWLDSESGYTFSDFLRTIDSCRKDQYFSRLQLIQQKPEMKLGDTVVMHTCIEAESYKDKLWTITTEPRIMCGSWVVWLEGYSGCFACEYLQVISKES